MAVAALIDLKIQLRTLILNFRDARYVRWDREVDSYYPRDKYRDVLEYFGSR